MGPKAAVAAPAIGNGVYVKNWGVEDAAAAKAAFEVAGPISTVQIRRRKYALVFFENSAAAKKAIDTFNGKEVAGTTVTVVPAKTTPKKNAHEGTSVVSVSPIFRSNTSRKAVLELFKNSGKVIKLRTYKNNSAYVYFDSSASAAKAVKDVNGKEFHQVTLSVKPSVRSLAKEKARFEHSKFAGQVRAWAHHH
eukprot:GDKK01046668.1.p2 GENE.GDKK01046668.1~~GDKK01046668.1.p2  ORF type:complete len:193 (-),score=79.05 GDKK01046668.1:61-639(-)